MHISISVKETLTLHFDGGSRGNPGLAGIGAVVYAADGTPLITLGRYIGRATNNVAEYRALITAMEAALKLGATKVIIRGDSELVIKQMRGEYRVKNPDLRDLYEEAQSLLSKFEQVRIEHNFREKNAMADKLANLAMDRKSEVTDVDQSPLDIKSPEPTRAGRVIKCYRCGCTIEVKQPSKLYPHQFKPFRCQCGQEMGE